MPFSWEQAKKNAIDVKIRRAITSAKSGKNPDFKLAHPDWVRDAQKNDYTMLKKLVRELTEQKQMIHTRRMEKLGGKS